MLVSFGGISLQAQDITLTVELNTELDLNTQYTSPAMYDNIKTAVDAAFSALGTGETLATDGGRVTKLILKGSAPWSYFDLRGIRMIFAYGGKTTTPAAFPYQYNNVTEIDMSDASLVSAKIQAPLQWTAAQNKYTENSYANIESGAFAYLNSDITKIVTFAFPASMTSIGAKTFGRCKTLTNVTLPEGLLSIGGDAFNSCTALTFPNGLPAGMNGNCGPGAFNGCSNLELTSLPENLAIYGDASSAFMGCAKVVLSELPVKRWSVTDGSKDFIPKELFKNTGISINRIPEPESWKIYQIAENAFENCADIDTITLPASFGGSNSRIQSKIGAKAFALPAESPVQRVYIFEAPVPPLAGTAVDAFYKGAATDATAIVYVPDAAAVTAFKAVEPYANMNVVKIVNIVKTDAGGHGNITTGYGAINEEDSTIQVRKNEDITFSFTTDYGYEISKVFINEVEITLSEESTYTFNSTWEEKDFNIRVEYVRNVFFINLNEGEHGSITTEYGEITNDILDVNINDDVTFTFTANRGYEITKVLVDEAEVELTDNTYTFTGVTTDHSIAVEYARNLFNITLDEGEHGTIATEYGEITDQLLEVNKNDSVTFTFTADRGYEITKVLVDEGEVELTENTYTIEDVTGDHTIAVEYQRNLFVINIEITGGGSVSTAYGEITDHQIEVNRGDTISFTFVPNSGTSNVVIALGVDDAPVELPLENNIYTLTDVTGDHTIAVTFGWPAGMIETGVAPIACQYYTLQGIEITKPIPGRVYLVKYSDLSIRKQIITNK
ncbi:hypothetical protein FACS189413_06410 [Bacteroidia bacterium]|nr:hypothetical protein FACS189413_06410 [Bacteroidia bacterium]